MSRDLAIWTRECDTCQQFKNDNKQYGELVGELTFTTPWKNIAIDIMGPMDDNYEQEETEGGDNRYILTIIDLCSRWVELIPLQEISANRVATEFDVNWLCRYPKPDTILSDNGTQFISYEFQELLLSYNIKQILTSTYNPQGNSICERIHSTIANSLRCAQAKDWSEQLPAIAWSLRSSYHRTLKCTPSDIVFGVNMINPEITTNRQELLTQAITTKLQQSKYDLARANLCRIEHEYRIGDLIYVKRIKPAKFEPRFEGPYRIHSINERRNIANVDYGFKLESVSFRRLKPFERKSRMSQTV